MTDLISENLNVREDAKWSLLPFLILIIILFITLWSCFTVYQTSEQRNEEHFNSLANEIQDVLLERYFGYEESLRGGLGLFYGSIFVERGEWRLFVNALHVETTLPGINGIGYIDYVREADLPAYLEKVREDSVPEFTNYPDTEYDDKFIIKYIEPVGINKEAVGLDIGFEATRREAAERARDNGVPALTKKIELVQDHKKQPGFLLLLPVYDIKEVPKTIQERREHFQGWVYAPFIGSNFFKDLSASIKRQLHFKVYDGGRASEEALIYASYTPDNINGKKNRFFKTSQIAIAGNVWTLEWSESEDFISPSSHAQTWLVGALGLLLAICAFYVLKVLVRSRAVISQEVEKRTIELEDIASFQQLMTDTIPDFLFVKDEKFRIVQANKAFLNLYPEDMRDQVIGTTTIENFSEEDAEEFLKYDKEAFERGGSSVEERIHFPDGKVRVLATQKVRFQNSQGMVEEES